MPLQSFVEKANNHIVAVWKIEESVEQLKELLSLSEADAEVVNAFKIESRQKEWLASRLLLKQALGFYPELEYSANGKPTLKKGKPYISITHTKGFAAVCVSDQPTGIDIELCSSRIEKVAKRFVHPQEAKYIEEKSNIEYLTVLWSAKETLYKYYDVYGVIFNEQFLIRPFKLNSNGELNCNFIHNSESKQLKLYYELKDGYALVHC